MKSWELGKFLWKYHYKYLKYKLIAGPQSCPSNFPFAYLNGQYCCKSNQERPNGGNTAEKESGTCDGLGFSKESTCCLDNAYQKCPAPGGCDNYQGTYVVEHFSKAYKTLKCFLKSMKSWKLGNFLWKFPYK